MFMMFSGSRERERERESSSAHLMNGKRMLGTNSWHYSTGSQPNSTDSTHADLHSLFGTNRIFSLCRILL